MPPNCPEEPLEYFTGVIGPNPRSVFSRLSHGAPTIFVVAFTSILHLSTAPPPRVWPEPRQGGTEQAPEPLPGEISWEGAFCINTDRVKKSNGPGGTFGQTGAPGLHLTHIGLAGSMGTSPGTEWLCVHVDREHIPAEVRGAGRGPLGRRTWEAGACTPKALVLTRTLILTSCLFLLPHPPQGLKM